MSDKKQKSESVSVKFICIFISVLALIIFYSLYPSDSAKKSEKKSFEELLEYKKRNVNEDKQTFVQENTQETVQDTIQDKLQDTQKDEIPEFVIIEEKKQLPENSQTIVADNRIELYNKLLDELAQYPSKSEYAINNITNRLLAFKGYPMNTIKVVVSDLDQSAIKTSNDFMLANFDILNGNMNISKTMLYELDIRLSIAVLAHELDHFDKLAQLCKSIGIDAFKKIFTDNGISRLNTEFWESVSRYSNIKNFDVELYKGALKRFLTQEDLDKTSLYTDFFKLSEDVRNPMEISAYKESDYVYKHYNIPDIEGDMKKIAKIFNKVDWAIYEFVQKNPILQDERITIFDYILVKSIAALIPQLNKELQYCESQKNGDLTSFWNLFKNRYESFYKQDKMTKETANDFIILLNAANISVNKGITPVETAIALKFKMNTLKSNLVSFDSVSNLRKTAINYLKYIKQNNVNISKSQEFNAIITLICIDNELYANSFNHNISLYNLKMPEEITQLYSIEDKHQKLMFLYNHPGFKSINSAYQLERDKLVDILNKSRLVIKNQ